MTRRWAILLTCVVLVLGACADAGQQAAPSTGSGMSVVVIDQADLEPLRP